MTINSIVQNKNSDTLTALQLQLQARLTDHHNRMLDEQTPAEYALICMGMVRRLCNKLENLGIRQEDIKPYREEAKNQRKPLLIKAAQECHRKIKGLDPASDAIPDLGKKLFAHIKRTGLTPAELDIPAIDLARIFIAENLAKLRKCGEYSIIIAPSDIEGEAQKIIKNYEYNFPWEEDLSEDDKAILNGEIQQVEDEAVASLKSKALTLATEHLSEIAEGKKCTTLLGNEEDLDKLRAKLGQICSTLQRCNFDTNVIKPSIERIIEDIEQEGIFGGIVSLAVQEAPLEQPTSIFRRKTEQKTPEQNAVILTLRQIDRILIAKTEMLPLVTEEGIVDVDTILGVEAKIMGLRDDKITEAVVSYNTERFRTILEQASETLDTEEGAQPHWCGHLRRRLGETNTTPPNNPYTNG